jgi:asparagine synthetase B (glutamine-hydrolysing)
MVVAPNGNVYANVYNGDIYMMTELNKRFKINLSNVTNSDLGSIVESVGTIVKV